MPNQVDLFGNPIKRKHYRILAVEKPTLKGVEVSTDSFFDGKKFVCGDERIKRLMSLTHIKMFRDPKLDAEEISRRISEISNWDSVFPEVEKWLIEMPNYSVLQAVEFIAGGIR